MPPMFPRLAVLVLAATLVGCPAPNANPNTGNNTNLVSTQNSSVKGAVNSLNVAMDGTLQGFGGASPRFATDDAAKISIVVENEQGETLAGTDPAPPTSNGAFTIKNVPGGQYFVVANLPDNSTNEALLRTDSGTDNFISPGTTLACAWARHELGTMLVFVGDLDYRSLIQLSGNLDTALSAKQTKLADTDSARFQQVQALITADAGLKLQFASLDKVLGEHATDNAGRMPPYVSQKDYDAKKAKLQ